MIDDAYIKATLDRIEEVWLDVMQEGNFSRQNLEAIVLLEECYENLGWFIQFEHEQRKIV